MYIFYNKHNVSTILFRMNISRSSKLYRYIDMKLQTGHGLCWWSSVGSIICMRHVYSPEYVTKLLEVIVSPEKTQIVVERHVYSPENITKLLEVVVSPEITQIMVDSHRSPLKLQVKQRRLDGLSQK